MAKPRPDLHSLQQSEIATLLGLSTRQIHNLVVDGGAPGVKSVDGKKIFDAPVFVRWYWEAKLDKAVKEASPPDEWDSKARHDTARAEMLELDLAERRRHLLSADYVAQQMTRVLSALKDTVLTIQGRAQRFTGLRSPAEAKAALRELQAELLRSLAAIGGDAAMDEERSKDRAA